MEHPKTSNKLSKTIRQTEKIFQAGLGESSNNFLYRNRKSENFLKEKNLKIAKWAHAFKGYASSYNVEILNSFNHEIQLKATVKNELISNKK